MNTQNLKIIGLSHGIHIAEKIAQKTSIHLIPTKTSYFADGEILVMPLETVRHQDVIVVQSICGPVNNNLMELLICIDALKRAFARSITVIITYYGYARQDRKSQGREPITSKLVAKMIENAGANRILLIDIHSDQTQGFFEIPVDMVYAYPILLGSAIKDINIKNCCVVSPDYGSVKRAREIAKTLNCNLAILDKRRPKPNVAEILNVLGDVKNKNCLIVDDMIDTAGTITMAAQAVKKQGAKSVRVVATHGVLSNPAMERLTQAFKTKAIDYLYLSNSIPRVNEIKDPHIKIVDLSPWLAGIIKVLYSDSPSSLSVYVQKCKEKALSKK